MLLLGKLDDWAGRIDLSFWRYVQLGHLKLFQSDDVTVTMTIPAKLLKTNGRSDIFS